MAASTPHSPCLRGPGRTRRLALMVIGVLIGLGVLGGTTGTVLGHIGAASSTTDVGRGHHHLIPDSGPFPNR